MSPFGRIPGLTLHEVKITNYGKDPTGIISMSLGIISGCKAVGHSSLDKMHLGKSWTGTTKTVGKP